MSSKQVTNSITYREGAIIDVHQLSALFTSSGIRRPTDDLDRLQKMIDNANITFTAWDGETLVAIARAVTDFVYCCYLSDLAVSKEYQGQGIGSALIEQLRSKLGTQVSLLLVSAPEATEFYPKAGMDRIDHGWIIRRTS